MQELLSALQDTSLGKLLLIIPLITAFYFLPSIIYVLRLRPKRARFITINLLTGWTFAVWAALIVWAVTGRSGKLGRQDSAE